MVTTKFVAGSLRHHVVSWTNIGCTETVINWISEGVTLPFQDIPPSFEFKNRNFGITESTFINSEINDLLASGAIRRSEFKPRCVSPIHCVPKKNHKLRLVIDLREVNKYCPCPAFQYEDINRVLEVVQPHDHLVTFDIKNGFHHIPVHDDFQQYLGFQWQGIFYVWQVLPFGLAVSPYFFCKCLRQVAKFFRSQGIRLSVYVDDFIHAAPASQVTHQRDFMLQTFQALGLFINFEKSHLDPSQEKSHIGYIISTNNSDNQVWIRIPKQRINRVKHDIRRALRRGQLTARNLARITGQCISMSKAFMPAKLLLRNLYRILRNKTSWQDILTLDKGAILDLQWWMCALDSWNGTAAPRKTIDLQITTDASQTAWGGHCLNFEAQGFWDKTTAHQSSNYRELSAILLTMQSFVEVIRNKSVQILSDNVTAVAYVNFQGGPSTALTAIARQIWTLAARENIFLSAKHLAGSDNYHADRLSRLPPTYEWKLHPRVFSFLDKIYGPHSLDRFASMQTTQLPRYNSLYWDPYTEAVDALAQTDWELEINFVNPPFRLLNRVLDVIINQRAQATIIAPWWPSQTWFNRLLDILISPPLKLPHSPRCFLRMGACPESLKNRRWTIYAWRVSGRLAYSN